jgi:hypothetical protein
VIQTLVEHQVVSFIFPFEVSLLVPAFDFENASEFAASVLEVHGVFLSTG